MPQNSNKTIRAQLHLLPLVAAGSWFITLFILLFYWLGVGRPRYSSQEGNVAFISDVGAQTLKPLFVIGATITSIAFWLSLVAIHHIQSPNRQPRPPSPSDSNNTTTESNPTRTVIPSRTPVRSRRSQTVSSMFAIVGTFFTGASLIGLAGFDTLRYINVHRLFLAIFMLGVLVGSVGSVTLAGLMLRKKKRNDTGPNQTDDSQDLGQPNLDVFNDSDHLGWLRRSFWMKLITGSVLLVLGAAFAVRLGTTTRGVALGYNQAGIMEWVIGAIYTLYILTFWYDLRHMRGSTIDKSLQDVEKAAAGNEGISGGRGKV